MNVKEGPTKSTADAWEDESEEKTPLYEVEDFNFDKAIIGKRLHTVEVDLSQENIKELLSEDAFHKKETFAIFELEGVDGILIATHFLEDAVRSSFGGWKIIKGIKSKRVNDLGTIKSLEYFDERKRNEYGDLQGDEGTRVKTTKATIEFGDNYTEAYYYDGFFVIQTNKP